MEWGFIAALGTLVVSIVIASWRQAVWLGKQFSDQKEFMISIKDQILDKLEYHERHDDQRFASVSDELWAIKVRNAGADDFARKLLLDKSKEIK